MYKMESYCLMCKKNIDPTVSSTSNGTAMIVSNCAICGSKTSRFIKHQEAKGLLSKLAIKRPYHILRYFVLNANSFESVC